MPRHLDFLASQRMEPVRRRLDNGLPVRLLSQPWLNRSALCLRVSAGSHDEPLAYPGLAHFLEHVLFLGSVGFAGEQHFMPFVQACAGQVNATTQARFTEYFCEVPADCLEGALERLLDMVARPHMGEAEQVREREVVHAEFVARSQDTATLIDAALGQALAEGHRCGVFQAGNRETLPVDEAVFQEALRTFHDSYYNAANCQLSIVGPQSIDELYDLAQRHGQCMAEGRAAVRELPALMLPLRADHLRLNLPGDSGSLHLGFALELPAASVDTALAALQDRLMDESPGGLIAQGRERGVGELVDAQVLYCHAGQALLLLSFHGVTSPPGILALVLDWLAFVSANTHSGACLASYKALRQIRLYGMTPLALARSWQQTSCCEEETVSELLQQLQDPVRRCVLIADNDVLPSWGRAGFPLRMSRVPALALALPVLRGRWKLPEPNPFLAPEEPVFAALAVPVTVDWLPAPKLLGRSSEPIAVWQARLCFAEPLGAKFLLNLAQISLREVRQHLSQVGISLTLDAESACLSLRLQGLASFVPRAVALLIPALLQPSAANFSVAVAGMLPDRQSMPIRKLLAASIELLHRPSVETHNSDIAVMQLRYSQVRIDALGVGLEHDAQQQIAVMFTDIWPLQTSRHAVTVATGQHWRTLTAEGDSALLLFCPQPDQSAATEACWRLLGQMHQGAFYQRMRSELQLGYAVFCTYRQIQGRRGLLFGVQSSGCNGEEILEHIRAYMQARKACLLELNAVALARAVGALGCQLQGQARSCAGLAEQTWQEHLAGLPREHCNAVIQALQQVSLGALQAAQQALSQADGGWYVLSNDKHPA